MTVSDSQPASVRTGERRRIRILHLVTSLEPGGLENGVVNLANQLNPLRFETSIACLERVGEFAQRLGIDTALTCFDKPPGFRFSTIFKLARMIARTRPDIIHTHNLGPLIYGTLANIANGNTAVVLQGEHAQLRPDEKTLRRRLTRKACYRACGMVHTVSSGLRDDLVSNGFPNDRIRVILNGVDCVRFSPALAEERKALRKQHGLPEDSFVVGIVGRFGAFKGHSRLIRGFEQLAGEHAHLQLLMVGDHGPEKDRVLEMAETSRYRERIAWSGFQKEPADFYRMMDLLVVPSENEGLSNALLEAMACGVACIAHPACGANEVIVEGVNGMLRPMADADQLAIVIRDAISDPLRLREMGAQARLRAEVGFSMSAMLSDYSRLYEEICGTRSESGKHLRMGQD
jgi:glycosyltransferase involved in cell wall biosynthesis